MSEEGKVIQVNVGDLQKAAEKIGYERGYADAKGKSPIHEALAKVQSVVKAAGKSGKNEFDHYDYAMLIDYIDVIREPMAENGLSITVTVSKIERLENRTTSKGGTERVVQVELTGTLRHVSGECLDFVSYGEGQDRSDKAIYKAITGGKKYLLANIFNIPTTDDPEGSSDEERGFNQDPTGKPPKAQQLKPAQSPAKTPVKADKPIGAKTSQESAVTQGMTDQQRKDAGLINQTQFEEVKALLESKGIKGPANQKKWKEWLKKIYGYDSLSLVEVKNLEAIKDTILKHPEQIMNPTVTRQPGEDDELPY